MFDQRLVSRIMLWSLALAAVLGVAGVLFSTLAVVGRVTGTALLTSVCAALLWQTSLRLEQSRTATKVAQVGVVLFYLFALGGIWELGHAPKLWFTALVCLGSLTVAASGWFYRRHADYRHTGLVVATAAIVSGICWLFGIWLGDTFDRSNKFPFIGTAVAGWGASAAICLIGVGTDQVRHWRWIGIAAAVLGFLLSIHVIDHGFDEPVTDWLFVVGSTVVVVIHAVLCFAQRSAPSKLPVRTVAIISTIATAVLCDVMILTNTRNDSILLRLATAAGIVASASTIATAVMIQRYSRQSQPEKLGSPGNSNLGTVASMAFRSVQLTCPNCTQQIEVPVGHSTCPNCKLAFCLGVGS